MSKKQPKKLTPVMLATALVTVSSSAMAYDHKEQTSILKDESIVFKSPYETLQDNTFTQTVNPQTGMIYSDND